MVWWKPFGGITQGSDPSPDAGRDGGGDIFQLNRNYSSVRRREAICKELKTKEGRGPETIKIVMPGSPRP